MRNSGERGGVVVIRVMVAAWVIVAVAVWDSLAAQEPAPGQATVHAAPTWDPILSIGQPTRWRASLGLGYGVDGPVVGGQAGVTAADPVLYFMVGSLNKNVRSMALDGEAMAVVAGAWALQAYLDFGLFSGGVDWIETLEELGELLPPYPRHQRWIARYIQYVL